MQNFQGMIFKWIQTYRETFKSALVYAFWKFLFVDHPKEDRNEREFKPHIIGEILDVPKNPSKTRGASIIIGPQLNIIESILKLLKIFSEVIVASTCCPLARIEKQAMS